MEKVLEKIIGNPVVQTAGKIGIAIAGAITVVKAGQWAWNKSSGFRSEIKGEFNKVKEKLTSKNTTTVSAADNGAAA